MIRNPMKKVMWIGKATVFAVGLAVTLAVLLGVATTALAAMPGDPLKLGKINKINRLTTLVGSTTGAVLRVDNDGTGTALSLEASADKPPLVVNNSAGTATNLDADQLDGQDASAFLPGEIYEKSVSGSVPADNSAGLTVSCDPQDVAVSGSYAISQAGRDLNVTSERRVDERFDAETGETNPSGWHVIAENTDTTASATLTVYVNCADRLPARTL